MKKVKFSESGYMDEFEDCNYQLAEGEHKLLQKLRFRKTLLNETKVRKLMSGGI